MAKRGVFEFDTLTPALKRMLPVVDAGVDLAFDAVIPLAATHMRTNAKWTDRTGNARNGLQAAHDKIPMVEHVLVMYHTMPYGYWLEIRWSGRYAVIGPSMLVIGPQLAVMVAEAVRRAVDTLG